MEEITSAVEYGQREENWVLSPFEDQIFFAVAPRRCYYGKLGDKQISYIQTVTYGKDEEYCYIGAYLVYKEYRHHGYGKKMWDFACGALPENTLVSLSSVLQQEHTYIRSGFKTFWNEFTFTFNALKIAQLPPPSEECIDIIQYEEAELSKLVEYDTNIFCYSREVYLKTVREISDCKGWVATDQDGKIVGYAIASRALEWLIAPLIADNWSAAQSLLVQMSKFLATQPVKFFRMSIPAINTTAMTFANEYSEVMNFESKRMFARGKPSQTLTENHAKFIFSMNLAIG